MAESIIKNMKGLLSYAIQHGENSFRAYGKLFRVNKITDGEFYTTFNGKEIGLRYANGMAYIL